MRGQSRSISRLKTPTGLPSTSTTSRTCAGIVSFFELACVIDSSVSRVKNFLPQRQCGCCLSHTSQSVHQAVPTAESHAPPASQPLPDCRQLQERRPRDLLVHNDLHPLASAPPCLCGRLAFARHQAAL